MKKKKISIKDFAEKILGISHDKLKKEKVAIKFIVTPGRVIFDPELFLNIEKTFGEGSFYHKDIADAAGISRGIVEGGAFLTVSYDHVKVAGASTDFGSIEGHEKLVRQYFEDYFDCPVAV